MLSLKICWLFFCFFLALLYPWADLGIFYYELFLPDFLGNLYSRVSIDDFFWLYLSVLFFLSWDTFSALTFFYYFMRSPQTQWLSFLGVVCLYLSLRFFVHFLVGNFIHILIDFAQQGFLFDLPVLLIFLLVRSGFVLFEGAVLFLLIFRSFPFRFNQLRISLTILQLFGFCVTIGIGLMLQSLFTGVLLFFFYRIILVFVTFSIIAFYRMVLLPQSK